MNILSSAQTWFFDSLALDVEGNLNISLIEGIKAVEREFVEIDENNRLGPYYPVNVTARSRIIQIQFKDIMTYSTTRESYDIGDERLVKDGNFLFKCSESTYLKNVLSSTSINELEKSFCHYLLWTEDFLINIITNVDPIVQLSNKKPNLQVERTSTYVAS